MAPIMDGLGLLLVIFSYAGRISIGITSCQDMVPDPENLADCFEQALVDLEQSADEIERMMREGGAADVSEPDSEPETEDPMAEFRKAEQALDAAIAMLTEKNKNEET
jgi:hypothetical protein